MNSFIFIAKGTLPEGSIKQDQDKNFLAFSRYIMNTTIAEREAMYAKIPKIDIFQHPLKEETLGKILSFCDFTVCNQGELLPYPDYESPYNNDYSQNPYPVWNAYSLSIDFQYIDLDKRIVRNETFSPRGDAIYMRHKFLHLLLLALLLKYDMPLTKKFFDVSGKHIEHIVRENWNKSSIGPFSKVIYKKELLTSYFSFLANPDDFYIWPNKEKKNSIIKDFFDILLTPNINRYTLKASENPLEWEEEENALLHNNPPVEKLYYHSPVKGNIIIIEKEGKKYITPILVNPTLSYFYIDENLNLKYGEKKELNLKYCDSKETIKIERSKLKESKDKYSYKITLDVVGEETVLPVIPSHVTEYFLDCMKEIKPFFESSNYTLINKFKNKGIGISPSELKDTSCLESLARSLEENTKHANLYLYNNIARYFKIISFFPSELSFFSDSTENIPALFLLSLLGYIITRFYRLLPVIFCVLDVTIKIKLILYVTGTLWNYFYYLKTCLYNLIFPKDTLYILN